MMPVFHAVLGNRDTLKVGGERRPVWEFIPGQRDWLTSLVYLRRLSRPPDARFILDCGAWSYKSEQSPRWTPEGCIALYQTFGKSGDIVTAPDHMVLRGMSAEEEEYRTDLTLENARDFLNRNELDPTWRPMAVTHGSTVEARLAMTEDLLSIGYRHIAIGSVAIRAGNRRFIREILEATNRLREQEPFYVHVLGVSALSWVPEFWEYGVNSYDGSAMFFSAFTAGEFFWLGEDGRIVTYDAKRGSNPDDIPLCDCPACLTMRSEGIDTRTFGSNENNMGRAVHNVNVYRKGYLLLREQLEGER